MNKFANLKYFMLNFCSHYIKDVLFHYIHIQMHTFTCIYLIYKINSLLAETFTRSINKHFGTVELWNQHQHQKKLSSQTFHLVFYSNILVISQASVKFLPKMFNFDERKHPCISAIQELLNDINNDYPNSPKTMTSTNCSTTGLFALIEEIKERRHPRTSKNGRVLV